MPPLSGIRVLDFTHLLPGELCAALLSDLGAEVIRIESPVPGLAHKLPPIIEGESLFYWSMQRDKSRLHVDLKTAEGVELIKRLVCECDVVIENFRVGVMERLGLGYETLSAINERILFLSITGYGHDSERKDTPVHDLNLCAETGLLSLNRRENERPVIPAIPISDYMAGLLAAISILAALYERKPGDKGRALDISMSDSALASLNVLGSMVLYTKKSPEEGEFAYPKEFPNYNVYECHDGRFLAVACLERPFWTKFVQTLDRQDLEPLIDNKIRHPELIETLKEIIQEKTAEHWSQIFAGTNCCVSVVNTINEAFENYPLKERQMVADLMHPVLGNIPQIVFPVDRSLRKISEPQDNDSRASHLVSLLNKIGYERGEIDKLVDRKIISLPAVGRDVKHSAHAAHTKK